ncbi:MAG TPA: hypothetical protein VK922_15640 [Gemmatimonadaceae bacterium]|nr:hypothetical protein [Gemmatimonadaceae bacterium]
MSAALGDRDPARRVPRAAVVQTAVDANDETLLQHPRRVDLGAAASAAKSEGSRAHAALGGLVRLYRAPRTSPGALELRRTSDTRHRAHRHPDATAPPRSG